jgi:hypothetical protein
MFEHELRFYREIAPEVGFRVPECYEAVETGEGSRLVLEDLSSWAEGGDPVKVAVALKHMHERWLGIAEQRWPWLKRDGRGASAIGELYDRLWSGMQERPDLTPVIRDLGDGFAGKVAALEGAEATAARRTLIHGDASLKNVRTSSLGVIAFLDWEDVRSANGCVDLTWLLVSSVRPELWDDVISAYGADATELTAAFPNAAAQGIFSFGDSEPGSADATRWVAGIEAVAARLI